MHTKFMNSENDRKKECIEYHQVRVNLKISNKFTSFSDLSIDCTLEIMKRST